MAERLTKVKLFQIKWQGHFEIGGDLSMKKTVP